VQRSSARRCAQVSLFEMGLALLPVKAQGLVASWRRTSASTSPHFSLFLMASAIAALFFRLGVEQRLREVGLLKALGFAQQRIRNLFLLEGLLLAAMGSLAGVCGGVAYASLMMQFLRTWWVGAVGTTDLSLHVSAGALLAGAAGGIFSAAGCIAWTLHRMLPASPRGLLAGVWTPSAPEQPWERGRLARIPGSRAPTNSSGSQRRARRSRPRSHAAQFAAVAFVSCGTLAGPPAHASTRQEAFLEPASPFWFRCYASIVSLRRRPDGLKPPRLDAVAAWLSSSSDRPGRSVLCIASLPGDLFWPSTHFAVTARSAQPPFSQEPQRLAAPSVRATMRPWGSHCCRSSRTGTRRKDAAQGFQIKTHDRGASLQSCCLTRRRHQLPQFVSAQETAHFGARTRASWEGRFAFKQSLAAGRGKEIHGGCWTALTDGAVPVIGDANSLAYVLHLKVETSGCEREGREAVKLRRRSPGRQLVSANS
jgi:hypothetical protein